MREVQATEAKAQLAALLNRVARGEVIAITRHGKRIAHLIPADTQDEELRKKAVARFRNKQRSWPKSGMSLDDIMAARHEGHRL